jgi:hypothetical protein
MLNLQNVDYFQVFDSYSADIKALIDDLINAENSYWTEETDEDGDLYEFDTLTIGLSEDGWDFQTGDNSFSGGAYRFPVWVVAEFYPTDTVSDVMYRLRINLETSNPFF